MSDTEFDDILTMGPVAYRTLNKKAATMHAAGTPVAFVHHGEPNFDTPAPIREAAMQAMNAGHTHYVPNIGMAEVRGAVAEKLRHENGITVDPDTEVIITNGGSLGLWLAIMVSITQGDEVLLLSPTFSAFADMVALAGGHSVYVPKVRQGGRFGIDRGEIVDKINSRTRAIMINTPNNPTGTVYTHGELETLAEIAEEYDLVVIADEAYEKLVYDGHRHISIASLGRNIQGRTVTVHSFSKSFAMTGWRLGYTAANMETTRAMSHLYQHSARCATAFVQMAGIAALRDAGPYVQEMVAEYKRRRDLFVRGLNEIDGIQCASPEGTFYVFPDISAAGLSAWEFVVRLLEHANVLATPGSIYGPEGEGFLRLSFSKSRSEIEQAIEGIARFMKTLF